jgi:hypothetical protein
MLFILKKMSVIRVQDLCVIYHKKVRTTN